MIRLARLPSLVPTTPAMAWQWHGWLPEPDTHARVPRLTGTSLVSADDPQSGIDAFAQTGWPHVDGYDGNAGFQSGDDYAMLSLEPGLCMFETLRMGTDALATRLLGEFEAAPTGTDAAGCATFGFPSVSAPEEKTTALTGGGNDRFCASTTEAALRFEVPE